MNEVIRQKRQFRVILIIAFASFVGISMPYLIFPALFLNPEYSILPLTWGDSGKALFLGVTLAAYPLGLFVGSPILGALSDDFGRKRLLSISLAVASVCNLISGLAIAWHNVPLLIAGRFLAGLMEGNIAIARAIAADFKTIPKHETFGKINAAISVSYLLGPIIGGLMADKNFLTSLNASTPFYCTSGIYISLAALSQFMLAESWENVSKKALTIGERFNFIRRMGVLFQNRQLKFLMLVSTAFTLAVDIFYEFGPVYLTVKWMLSPAQLVIYNGVTCIALVFGNGYLPRWFTSNSYNQPAMYYSFGLFGLFLLILLWINSTFLMLALFVLAGLVIGLGVTLITIKISDAASDRMQGEVMGVQISLRFLGDALICLFGGVLLLLSPKLILFGAALLSMATMLYYIRNKKKSENSF